MEEERTVKDIKLKRTKVLKGKRSLPSLPLPSFSFHPWRAVPKSFLLSHRHTEQNSRERESLSLSIFLPFPGLFCSPPPSYHLLLLYSYHHHHRPHSQSAEKKGILLICWHAHRERGLLLCAPREKAHCRRQEEIKKEKKKG